jgi:hypothetical protein
MYNLTIKYLNVEINNFEFKTKIIKNSKFKLELFIFIRPQNNNKFLKFKYKYFLFIKI